MKTLELTKEELENLYLVLSRVYSVVPTAYDPRGDSIYGLWLKVKPLMEKPIKNSKDYFEEGKDALKFKEVQ